jgi:phosphoribosylformimino-5-aminoimidazole carboxamide ribotide isomerase
MTLFRPCIDLHAGKVKQIVGSSLSDDGAGLRTNFESSYSAGYYAGLYCEAGLKGGHVIKLGPDNEASAREALAAYPGGLQIGGGISGENAEYWLRSGASHVIVTSWLFDDRGHFLPKRLETLVSEVGKGRLVIDLSCRAEGDFWVVMMHRWQTQTNLVINAQTLHDLSEQCSEFLVHAADVEGKCEGIDTRLVTFLGEHASIPITYAGGANSVEDLQKVHELSNGKVDLTIGSALDIFGGNLVSFEACLAWNRSRK